ncbi:hypothetical protein AB0L88_38080 [Saccharopolyspora shandongensis]|uniref:DUF402 domain-containing protein n=1 Tax=Saccharopolyspora shandongensis TaxID=418495 RepID=A0A1H3PBH1_9PSEU|nr:hypothetical protein [Saccharopolyspora shandongensis]SDY98421.1 hypothetical protein SAMN05216215_104162 [Saccharopolyspora shandongensis]
MSAAISPQLVEVIDVFSSQRRQSSGVVAQLEVCHVERWGLSVECPTPEAADHAAEITWLLPDLGLRLTRFRPRRRHSRRGPSLLTAVHIERETRSWTTTDLLLGLEVGEHGRPRITRAADFAAAVGNGLIRLSEADYALRTVHRTLDEVTRHRDINQWLAHRGIFDIW